MLTWNLKGKIVDIETAFLHGNFRETIYMEVPKVMEVNENECLISKKLRACPERKRILQKACFGVKRMWFSRKLRQSMPLDKGY
jgi:hypothetical protein